MNRISGLLTALTLGLALPISAQDRDSPAVTIPAAMVFVTQPKGTFNGVSIDYTAQAGATNSRMLMVTSPTTAST